MTDVVMPGVGGPALAAALREHHPALRMVFVSGHAEGASTEIARLGGRGSRFLSMPFTPGEPLATVAEAIAASAPDSA